MSRKSEIQPVRLIKASHQSAESQRAFQQQGAAAAHRKRSCSAISGSFPFILKNF
jgi:hypothetical protein